MKWQSLLLASASLLCHVSAIFSDDAFHIDYHQALLGVPKRHTTFFHKPQLSSEASLLYTISDKAVLGAVRPKDGTVVWRQSLAGKAIEGAKHTYLAPAQNGIVYSGFNNKVAAWDALDGRLIWESVLAAGYDVKGLQAVQTGSVDVASAVQHVIVLAGSQRDGTGAIVSRVGGGDAGTQWQYKDTSVGHDAHTSIAISPKHVFYVSKSSGILSGGKAKVVVLDILTGSEITQYSVSADSQPLGEDGSYVSSSCSGSPLLVSSEKPFKTVRLNVLGNTKVSTLTLEDKSDEIQQVVLHAACSSGGSPQILVHAHGKLKHWAEIYHVNIKTGEATKAYSLPAISGDSAFATSNTADTVYIARITDTEVLLYSSASHNQLGRWTRTSTRNESIAPILHANIEVSARGKTGLAIRAAVTSSQGEWTLIRNGETQWFRPEVLAYVTKAVWSEDTGSTLLAQEIQAEAGSNPVAAYLHRLSRHAQDLTHLPGYLMSLPQTILQPNEDAGVSVRQKLIGGKLVLATTSRGEILAIDAAHAGAIRWRYDLLQHVTLESRTVHLSTSGDLLNVYLSDGSVVVVEIATGKFVKANKGTQSVEKIVEISAHPASTVLQVQHDGKPTPLFELDTTTPSEGNSLVTINDKGEAIGWSVGGTIRQTWIVHPPTDAKFVEITARPAHDPVASIGKVLGDRSVLYKYISPNLALLTALSTTTLFIYLVNAVTGAVLHTSSHEGILTNFPIPTVISENWLAYSFTTQDTGTSGLTTQIIISELYESIASNDRGPLSSRTNYSSFAADAAARPHTLSQAYTIPAPISNLTVTQTLQGITSRQIIGILPDLNALVGIPRDVLDARRPVDRDITSAEAEEGLSRYHPVIQLDTKFFLTHTREVIGLNQIMTAPTLLESTSIVFAYGHDIFGTQVAPSNTFDVLGKGFKRVQLILTVVALYAGVLLIRPIVRKKMVDGRYL